MVDDTPIRRLVLRALATLRALASPSLMACVAFGPLAAFAEPEVGQPAPEFELSGSDGQTYTLASIFSSGKEGVVLAWFPKAFTPGWTNELRSLRDSEKELDASKVAYFMVSLDDAEKNKAFADSVGAHFVMLSDPDKANAKKYGVLGIGGLYAKRWTFYIDRNGLIQYIDKDVDTGTHGEDIVAKLGELGIGTTRKPSLETVP